MHQKLKVAIIGPGNIGTDLMFKVIRSEWLEMSAMLGVVESEGLKRARNLGFITSTDGIHYLEEHPEIADVVFDATMASLHKDLHAPLLAKLNKFAVDLTPAAVGVSVSPVVNPEEGLKGNNVNMITCVGQASTAALHAITNVVPVSYAEVIAQTASKSDGPATRKNIDEFTYTTQNALCRLGGAKEARVFSVINPCKPECNMRNTIMAIPEGEYDIKDVEKSVREMVARVQEYIPGYALTLPPMVNNGVITTIITVTGAGDFLPTYAGNLDMETASGVRMAELYAQKILGGANA